MIVTDFFPLPVSDQKFALTHCDKAVLECPTFFLLRLREYRHRLDSDNEVEVNLTALAFSFDAIQQIAHHQMSTVSLELKEVHIITSLDANGALTWEMDRLAAVWVVDDPATPGEPVELYETLSGHTYGLSQLGNQSDRFTEKKLLARFPLD